MTRVSEIADQWLGLCRKVPVFRASPVVNLDRSDVAHEDRPDGCGPAARPGRIRQGVSIAAGSLRTLVRDRYIHWFSFFSMLLMIFLFALIYWTRGTIYYDPFLIRILLGGFILWFDPRLIPILAFCIFWFTFLTAGLILYRNANRTDHPLTIREGLSGAGVHAGPLATLSIAMALAGTILIAVINSDNLDFFATISFPLMDTFLPYHWFLPSSLEFTITILFVGTILYVNLILFLALFYVIPVIVLEDKGLVPAIAGSGVLIRKTWREMLGCLLVYGAFVILLGAITLVISQSLSLLSFDPKFFYNQGLMPILAVGSEFILLCTTILMAAGSTAAGVAIADLYRVGTSAGISGMVEENLNKTEPAS